MWPLEDSRQLLLKNDWKNGKMEHDKEVNRAEFQGLEARVNEN